MKIIKVEKLNNNFDKPYKRKFLSLIIIQVVISKYKQTNKEVKQHKR